MDEAVHTLLSLLHAAEYSRHSLANEVAASLESARRGLDLSLRQTVRPQRQADYVANRVWSAKWRIAELEVLQATFANCRGEIGTLPVFRDKQAVCEPALAAFAQELAPEVERRVWDFLNEREVGQWK